ncbi:hypothetical protein [Paenibacillus sp. HB172176]|uniref:hypothetical protein n=1 Tax=Paenibacillus sp. HB172176 TaxID=2493690 RepID=UPI00143B32DF|nr:hypothetical protein [Paenibacillus sp. HB172176]
MLTEISNLVHRTVTKIWLKHIPVDYSKNRLYREASLQDCFYFHLRREIGDSTLESLGIFIYPEYYYQGKYVDMAVLVRRKGREVPLAIFEFKYLNSTGSKPFDNDIVKVLEYLKNDGLCKFYLGFVQEVEYDYPIDFSWLKDEQKIHASGRIVELTGGFFKPGAQSASWFIKEHT